MDELVIGDQVYISSRRAAKITGYAKDYIGQLCREGRVEARLVGRNWYVREAAIRDHRFGAENAPAADVRNDPVGDTAPTWQTPTYQAEVPREIPLSIEEPVEITAETNSPIEDTAARMQEAWQAWFAENKKPEAPVEVPIERVASLGYGDSEDQTEPSEEAEETPVAISRIEDEQEQELEIPIQRVREVIREPATLSSTVVARPTPPSRALTALLMVIGVTAFIVGTLGSGIIKLKGIGLTATVIDYISGVKTISK